MRSSATNNLALSLPASKCPLEQRPDVLTLPPIPPSKLTEDRSHHLVDVTTTDTPCTSSASVSEASGQGQAIVSAVSDAAEIANVLVEARDEVASSILMDNKKDEGHKEAIVANKDFSETLVEVYGGKREGSNT